MIYLKDCSKEVKKTKGFEFKRLGKRGTLLSLWSILVLKGALLLELCLKNNFNLLALPYVETVKEWMVDKPFISTIMIVLFVFFLAIIASSLIFGFILGLFSWILKGEKKRCLRRKKVVEVVK